MSLDIAVRTERGATVLATSGDIDVQTAPVLRDALAEATAGGFSGHVVLDLSGTDFLDSSALGVLVGVHKRFDADSGRLTIVCDKPHLLRVFKITRLSDVLTIVPSTDVALS